MFIYIINDYNGIEIDINEEINYNKLNIKTIKDENNKDEYLFIERYVVKGTNFLHTLDAKFAIEVYNKNTEKVYSYELDRKHDFIWLEFDSKESAGDRNVKYDEFEKTYELYNHIVVPYDLHNDYFYLLDVRDEAWSYGVYEYKISFNNGEVKKESKFYPECDSEYTSDRLSDRCDTSN